MIPSLSLCQNLRVFAHEGALPSETFNPKTFPRLEGLACNCTTESEVLDLCTVIRAYDNNISVDVNISLGSAGRGICALMDDPLARGVHFNSLGVDISPQDNLSHGVSGLPYPWQGRCVGMLDVNVEGAQIPPLSTLEGIRNVRLISRQQDGHVPPCELLMDARLLKGVEIFSLQCVDLALVQAIQCVGKWSLAPNDDDNGASWTIRFWPHMSA